MKENGITNLWNDVAGCTGDDWRSLSCASLLSLPLTRTHLRRCLVCLMKTTAA